jgi:serine/threonine protein kinase
MDSEITALEQYRLVGVQELGKEVGKGSCATVVEVEYKGLHCVGRKIRRQFYDQETEDVLRQFDDECTLLSQLQHPNIVQFIGIYFELDTNLPVLVMEFLPTTLAQSIDRYGILPEEANYSILRDVVLGLRYLHEMPHPISHCNLTANNVLLTGDMKAKISDVSLLPVVSHFDRTPQSQCCMPPEVQGRNPSYSIKGDMFSYGVMMVHVFSGKWPLPARDEAISNGYLDMYLDSIGQSHPLMQLILQCLSPSPDQRPEAVGVLRQVNKVASKFPPCFNNKLEMIKRSSQVSSLFVNTVPHVTSYYV